MSSAGRFAILALLLPALLLPAGELRANAQSAEITWNFDEATGPLVHDLLGNLDDRVEGFWDRVPGVWQAARCKFDGYTARIVCPAKWPRVTATFDPLSGLAIYIYGSQIGTLKTVGGFVRAEGTSAGQAGWLCSHWLLT